MEIDKIREEISIKLNEYTEIVDELNDTSPGHYGVNYWEVEVIPKDIWVDIPNRTFRFKNGSFSFTLIMGASKGDDSHNQSFSKNLEGNGTWDFGGNNSIKINSLQTKFDLDLFAE